MLGREAFRASSSAPRITRWRGALPGSGRDGSGPGRLPLPESDYAAWHVGPARIMGPDEGIQSGEFYTLYLDLASRQGRQALKRFVRKADGAGYGVTSWFSTPRSGATTQEGAPVTSLTFLLQQGSREENSPQGR